MKYSEQLEKIHESEVFQKNFYFDADTGLRFSAIMNALSCGLLYGLGNRVELIKSIKKSLAIASTKSEPELWLSALVSGLFGLMGGLGVDVVFDLIKIPQTSTDMMKVMAVDYERLIKNKSLSERRFNINGTIIKKSYHIVYLRKAIYKTKDSEWLEIPEPKTDAERLQAKFYRRGSELLFEESALDPSTLFVIPYNRAYRDKEFVVGTYAESSGARTVFMGLASILFATFARSGFLGQTWLGLRKGPIEDDVSLLWSKFIRFFQSTYSYYDIVLSLNLLSIMFTRNLNLAIAFNAITFLPTMIRYTQRKSSFISLIYYLISFGVGASFLNTLQSITSKTPKFYQDKIYHSISQYNVQLILFGLISILSLNNRSKIFLAQATPQDVHIIELYLLLFLILALSVTTTVGFFGFKNNFDSEYLIRYQDDDTVNKASLWVSSGVMLWVLLNNSKISSASSDEQNNKVKFLNIILSYVATYGITAYSTTSLILSLLTGA